VIMNDQTQDSSQDAKVVDVGGTKCMRYEAFVAKVRAPYEAELEAQRQAAARAAQAAAAGVATESRLAEQIREQARLELQAEREREARAMSEPQTANTDELLDHNYDGIQEYDNPTPGWWWLILWGSVAFSVIYVMVYHFSPIVDTQAERHARAEARMLNVRFAELSGFEMGEEKIQRIMAQEAWLDQGASIFAGNCALCHGQQGEGLVGPNLTDESYKNIDSLVGIADLVADGVGTLMPAQKSILNENEIALVAAYVASLRGKNIPGKDPEGEPIPPWPVLAPDTGMGATP
jgi:cytochrome c oxidase cbb3-type subunit 3